MADDEARRARLAAALRANLRRRKGAVPPAPVPAHGSSPSVPPGPDGQSEQD